MQSESSAKLSASMRMVSEQQEELNDELALEKLLAAKVGSHRVDAAFISL